jgi:hypothetical protein
MNDDIARRRIAVAVAAVPGALAIGLVALSLLPGISISDSAFKVLTLGALGTLTAMIATAEVTTRRTDDSAVTYFGDPATLYSVAAHDLRTHLGHAELIRVCSSSPSESSLSHDARGGFRAALQEVSQSEPPRNCQVRVLYGVSFLQDLAPLRARVDYYSNARSFFAKCVVIAPGSPQMLDPLIIGDRVAFLAYDNPNVGVNERGVRVTDSVVVRYLSAYFDELWDNSRFAVYSTTSGWNEGALTELQRTLASTEGS